MNEIIDKGQFNNNRFWGIIIGFLILGIAPVVLFYQALSEEYYNLKLLIAAIVLTLLFGSLLFKLISNYKAITIYEHTLQVRWLFGLIKRTINKEDIIQFGKSAIRKSDHIYIKTTTNDLLFEEKIIENEKLIFNQLRLWKIKRKDNIVLNEFSAAERKAIGIALMLFSVFLTGCLVRSLKKPTPVITSTTTFRTVTGHLQRTPEIKKPKSRDRIKDVIFYLHEYPTLKFSAGDPGYTLMNFDSLATFDYGDSIALLITQNEYDKKITKSKEPDYWEKHLHWSTVNVFDVEIANQKLLTLQAYKDTVVEKEGTDPITFIIALAILITIFVYGVWSYRNL